MQILWFIPNNHDERYLGRAIKGRAITNDDLQQIAPDVNHQSYTSALLPRRRFCEDAWMTAAALISVTKRTEFLVVNHPGITFLGVAAIEAATFSSEIYAYKKFLKQILLAPITAL